MRAVRHLFAIGREGRVLMRAGFVGELHAFGFQPRTACQSPQNAHQQAYQAEAERQQDRWTPRECTE
jgi:hypothetical protein